MEILFDRLERGFVVIEKMSFVQEKKEI